MTPDETQIDDMRDLRVLEATLFASQDPMPPERLQSFVSHLDDAAFQSLIARLKQDYAGRGITLEQTASGYAFRTAPDLAESLSELRVEERKLSRAAMETLSVVAYHQPITRPEIEAIRGVATSKGTIDALLETNWIKPGRRREAPGRPLTWVTTPAFLDHFGLESIVDLPGMDDLKAAGLLDRRPAVSVTADLFDGDEDANDDADADEAAA
jgi:segregation and condensation protein B